MPRNASAEVKPMVWDSFGALAAPLLSRVPVLVTGGNHEIGASEAGLHYMHRWPTPYREARSTSPLYWSADVGPVHVVALNSYDNFVNGGDRLQRKWLEDDLSKEEDAEVPTDWLIKISLLLEDTPDSEVALSELLVHDVIGDDLDSVTKVDPSDDDDDDLT